MRRIKIMATIGPRTNHPEAMRALVEAGVDLVRLNGAHADLTWHRQTIAMLRSSVPEIPILFDIPGRKIRIGILEQERGFAVGDQAVLTTDFSQTNAAKVPVTYANLHEDLSAGDTILGDNGRLRLTVVGIQGCDILCRVETAGILRHGEGINMPTVVLRNALVTDRDRQILEFACTQAVDFVGISFVESAQHVQTIRRLIGTRRNPRIVAKIEHQQGLEHLGEILQAADAVMIDRGDLAIETKFEDVAVVQKRILNLAAKTSCPVVVATEMLHSMTTKPQPTQAEISDISNAVLDGASALMLSAETAIGAFPIEAVATMRKVADAVWDHFHADAERSRSQAQEGIPSAMGEAVALLCQRLPITKIVSLTISGYAARLIAAQRPRQPILAVSNDQFSARAFNLLPGTQGVYVDIPFSRTSTDHIAACLEALWRFGHLVDEDLVLVTALGYPKSGNRLNLIQTHHVADLKESLQWEIPRRREVETRQAALPS